MTLILLVIVFLAVAGIIVLAGYRRYMVAGRVYDNLAESSPAPADARGDDSSGRFSVVRIAERVSGKAPASEKATSALRIRLLAAGYREQNAVAVLYGLKLISMAAITVVMLILELNSKAAPVTRILGVLVGVLAGFRLPDYVLSKRIKDRQKRLRKALPDALDLMIVCAEAGLNIDRSFRIVAQQLGAAHRELADEFNLFSAEVGAGLRRKEALANVAVRTQESEMRKFVGVLGQADRFGTSMGDALRTHADYLRTRRRQDAEEKASKVSVKMIFPIFFFMMPCMLLVTVGPALIVMGKVLLPALSGAH